MTEMSRERREELTVKLLYSKPLSEKDAQDLRESLRDSAWRERVERRMEELAERREEQAQDQHDAGFDWAATELSREASELRAIVDTGDEEGS